MLRIIYLTAIVLAVSVFSASAEQVTFKGECTLSFKGRVYAKGPCEGVTIDKKATEITGTVPENGVRYNAIITEEKKSGVLLGADTFVLAEGALDTTSAGALYVWDNGYALDIKISAN